MQHSNLIWLTALLLSLAMGQHSAFQVATGFDLPKHLLQEAGGYLPQLFAYTEVTTEAGDVLKMQYSQKAEVSLLGESGVKAVAKELRWKGKKQEEVLVKSLEMEMKFELEKGVQVSLLAVEMEGSEQLKQALEREMKEALKRLENAKELYELQRIEQDLLGKARRMQDYYTMKRQLHSLPTSLIVPYLFADSLQKEVALADAGKKQVLLANKPSKLSTKATQTEINPGNEDLADRILIKLEQELLSDLVLEFNGTYSLRDEVVKKEEARKEYYQKFLRVFKLAQFLPSIVEQYDGGQPYDFRLIMDEDYYKKLDPTARVSKVNMYENGETKIDLNAVMQIAVSKGNFSEVKQLTKGLVNTTEIEWDIARTVLLKIQISGFTELLFNSSSSNYELHFNLSSIEVKGIKMFFKDPLAPQAPSESEDEEDFAATIESSMQVEGVLFQSALQTAFELAQDQIPKQITRVFSPSFATSSPLLQCFGISVLSHSARLRSGVVDLQLQFETKEGDLESCRKYDETRFYPHSGYIDLVPSWATELMAAVKEEVLDYGSKMMGKFISVYQEGMNVDKAMSKDRRAISGYDASMRRKEREAMNGPDPVGMPRRKKPEKVVLSDDEKEEQRQQKEEQRKKKEAEREERKRAQKERRAEKEKKAGREEKRRKGRGEEDEDEGEKDEL